MADLPKDYEDLTEEQRAALPDVTVRADPNAERMNALYRRISAYEDTPPYATRLQQKLNAGELSQEEYDRLMSMPDDYGPTLEEDDAFSGGMYARRARINEPEDVNEYFRTLRSGAAARTYDEQQKNQDMTSRILHEGDPGRAARRRMADAEDRLFRGDE